MKKTKIQVCGMHCKSCELLLEKTLSKLGDIKSVNADEMKGIVEVEYTGDALDIKNISKIIEECGYSIGEKQKPDWITKDLNVYVDIILAIFLIFALYLLFNLSGFDASKFFDISTPSLSVAFLVGLTAGISSCMALVGGLVLGVSAKWSDDHKNLTVFQKFEPNIYFNIGRIVGFGFLGGILGLFGSIFSISTSVIGIITIITGVIMLLLGINLSDISPKISSFTLTLPKSFGKNVGNEKSGSKHVFALSTGALTFFLPCGFTLAMQAYAISTGNFISGALIMVFFALGTAPGLLGVGGLSTVLGGNNAKKFFRFTGILIIMLSIFNITNGNNLISLGGKSNTQKVSDTTNLEIQDIKMVQSGDGYSPSELHIKPNTKIRWHIEGTNPYSCSFSIVVPSLGINLTLKKGENIVEFVSPNDGEIKFSCSMGMYNGKFIVDTKKTSYSVEKANASSDINSTSASSGQGCKMKGSAGSCNTGNNSGKSSGCRMMGGGKNTIAKTDSPAQNINESPKGDLKKISATYLASGLEPQEFNLTEGKNYELTIDVKDSIEGCMSQILIPGFDENIQDLTAGTKIKFIIKATKKGRFPITCAMGVPHGFININ